MTCKKYLNVCRRVIVVFIIVVAVDVVEAVRLLPADVHLKADSMALVLAGRQADDRRGIIDADRCK